MKYVACALLAASAFGAGGCAMYQGLPSFSQDALARSQGALTQVTPTASQATPTVAFQGSSDVHPWAQRSTEFTPPFGGASAPGAASNIPPVAGTP